MTHIHELCGLADPERSDRPTCPACRAGWQRRQMSLADSLAEAHRPRLGADAEKLLAGLLELARARPGELAAILDLARSRKALS